MSSFTMDSVKQTQAYLLDEAVKIHNKFRRNSTIASLHKRPLVPLIALSTWESTNSPSTANSSIRKQFLELPDDFLNSLTPEIKVYKTYINQDGEEYTYLLPMGRYLEQDGVTQGVVVKSAEWTRLGGNPAEINTNIKFNLKLFAKDITTFFVKNEVMPMEPFTWTPPSEFAFTVAESEATSAVIRNLEQAQQINQDTLNAPVRDARLPAITPEEAQLIAESQADIERRISQNMSKLTRLNNKIDDLAQSAQDVAANGMRRVQWIDLIKIDPGQELEVARDAELVTSDNQVRIKVEIGYIRPTTKPINYNKDDWELWADVIEEQRETFYLSLFKHQFDFRGNDGIELSVDYIASADAIQLSPRADLFDNPEIKMRLKRLRGEVKNKEKQIKAAAQQETSTAVTDACISTLQNSIANIEERMRKINSKNKLRLLNQIYLRGDSHVGQVSAGKPVHYSRVYWRRYDTIVASEDSPVRQNNPEYGFGDGNTVSGLQEFGGASIQMADQDFATDGDATGESVTSRNYDTISRSSDMFIFLGDIIDAAIELLVPTGITINSSWRSTTSVRGLAPWTWIGPLSHEEEDYDSTYHPPMSWESLTAAGAAVERCDTALKAFGGIVMGWVSYTNPNNTDQTRKLPMRDIPIALDIFRSWWINKFVRSGRNTLPLKDFMSELMRFVEKDVFQDIPIEYGTNTDKIDTPKFIINSNPVNGFSRIYDRIYGIPSGESLIDKMSYASMSELAATFSGSHEGSSLFLTSIEQTDNKPKLQPTTPTIVFGETAEGLLKSITFEREDIPGHAEARLFSDRTSVAGNIALREKYNTKVDLLGTTTLLPGSLLYIDPLPLDLGYAERKDSLARSLGLGGMYRVVNLTSNINFDGSSNGWETTVNTKWEAFSDGNNGTSAATNPSSEDLGVCADLEADAAETPVPSRPFTSTGGVCFAAGTEISMHDGTKKNIEDIVIGDTVLSWDEETNEITRGNVSGLNRPLHDDMVNLTWGNITNKNTFDHPFYVKGKGWCSYAPDLTLKRYASFETVEKLETGDICYYINGSELEEIKLSNIEEEMGMIQTYIFSVEVYNTFFANNILTHNK